MIITRRRFEQELEKRMHEEFIRRQMDEDICRLRNQVCKLDCDLNELRMKVDPEYRKQHQVNCCTGSVGIPE